MSDDQEPRNRLDSSSDEDGDGGDVRGWLKGALTEDKPEETIDVLGGVQKKLRERSGGKFYADVWSTAKQPPTLTFLATSLFMLVIVALTYAVLAPLRGTPSAVDMEPKGVDVIIQK